MKSIDISDFYGNYSEEEEVGEAIGDIFNENGYLIDPHTAVAYDIYRKYSLETKDDTKTLISATASPFKFGTKVAKSIGIDIEGKDQFETLENLALKTGMELPQEIRSLREKPILHKNNCDKESMREMVEKLLGIE